MQPVCLSTTTRQVCVAPASDLSAPSASAGNHVHCRAGLHDDANHLVAQRRHMRTREAVRFVDVGLLVTELEWQLRAVLARINYRQCRLPPAQAAALHFALRRTVPIPADCRPPRASPSPTVCRSRSPTRLQCIRRNLVRRPAHHVVILLRILIDDADARSCRQIMELVEQHLLPILRNLIAGILLAIRATPATTTSPRSLPALRCGACWACDWPAWSSRRGDTQSTSRSSTWESRLCRQPRSEPDSPWRSTDNSTSGSPARSAFQPC